MRRYNAEVNSKLAIPLLAALLLGACNRAPENKEALRQAVVEHLNKNSGLDLQAMNIDVSNANFQGDKATATVSFKPKSSPDAGMSMNYTLERKGAKWIVQQKAGGAGHEAGTPPATDLPPGHPPVSPQPEAPRK